MTTVIKTVAFFRLQCSSSSKVDTALSVRAMELVTRRKQDEEKEQDPCACSESHARKYLRKCDEPEGRSSLESIRVAAGEGKDGRNDHESGHDRDRSVKDLNIFRRILDRVSFFI